MYILTSQEALTVDEITQKTFGIPGIVLMENAGAATARWIMKHYPKKKRIAIVAGGGNNGGDGYVVARHLFNHGYRVMIYLAGDRDKIKGDAKINLDIAVQLKIPVISDKMIDFNQIDLIVDALFGVGLSRPITGHYHTLINQINQSNKPVIAIDIPSGIDGSTGETLGISLKADATITYGYHKRGHFLQDGIERCGSVYCVDISFPGAAIESLKPLPELITPELVQQIFPRRCQNSHKYSYGHLLVVAGGGAATLCGLGALRSGCGIVTLATPQQSMLPPELIHTPLETTEIDQLLLKKSAAVFGPGVGLSEARRITLLELLQSDLPMVIDADGLTLLGTSGKELLNDRQKPIIITPHPGEMGRLLGVSTQFVEENRFQLAIECAKQYNITVVLKGCYTIIATPDGKTYLNNTGNHGMATAGSGDLLAGMIGAFLSRGISPEYAAILGVYLHGCAGDNGSQKRGYHGLIVSDMIDTLPDILKTFE